MEILFGKTCVVTGAAGGIGSALVRRLVRDGAQVVAIDRDVPELDGVALALAVDVSDIAAVRAAAERITRELGPVHLLVNNAGTVGGGRTWEIADEVWDRVLGTNLGGVLNGIRAFVPAMVANSEEPAHVVNTASMAGVATMPNIAPYIASKQAVVGVSETLHHDLREAGVTHVGVSVVCPGYVPTWLGMPDKSMPLPEPKPGQPSADDVADAIVDAVLTGRFYVFTHADSTAHVERRLRAIVDGTAPVSMT
ncbi:MAG TPA: SDR family NAD(P)-dependent oxidoreductase [Mycobacteriales bacterium]|nr:SDR family NAD(P)-dependent oxidoreductase [Mycobacteriales bacterium]